MGLQNSSCLVCGRRVSFVVNINKVWTTCSSIITDCIWACIGNHLASDWFINNGTEWCKRSSNGKNPLHRRVIASHREVFDGEFPATVIRSLLIVSQTMESKRPRFRLSYAPSCQTLIQLRHISSCSLSEYSPCASIEPADRLTCGWENITEDDCKQLGCCYHTDSAACFKTDRQSNSCKYQLICSQQVHALYGNIWPGAGKTGPPYSP